MIRVKSKLCVLFCFIFIQLALVVLHREYTYHKIDSWQVFLRIVAIVQGVRA
jgi:hypothetical protein